MTDSRWKLFLGRRPPPERLLSLAANQAAALGRPGPGLEVSCTAGLLLVTQEGDPADHVLGPGERIRFTGRGVVALMTFEPAQVRIAAVTVQPGGVTESARWNGATFGTSWR